MKKYTVQSNEEIAPDAYVLSFIRDFEFIPGQVVELTTNADIPPRMYSICSSDKEKMIKILYKVKSEGLLTPNLAQLSKGNKIYVSEPSGSFHCTENPAVWIATGTGIAPFISMTLSENHSNKFLIQGARNEEHLYFPDFLKSCFGNSYVKCCSKANSSDIFQGRLTQYLSQASNLSKDQKYYLCGSAEMVVDVRDILILKGISYSNIISEIYF